MLWIQNTCNSRLTLSTQSGLFHPLYWVNSQIKSSVGVLGLNSPAHPHAISTQFSSQNRKHQKSVHLFYKGENAHLAGLKVGSQYLFMFNLGVCTILLLLNT